MTRSIGFFSFHQEDGLLDPAGRGPGMSWIYSTLRILGPSIERVEPFITGDCTLKILVF